MFVDLPFSLRLTVSSQTDVAIERWALMVSGQRKPADEYVLIDFA